MRLRIHLFISLVYATVIQSTHFSYERCAANGPHSEGWTGLHCRGTEGSPIDVCGAVPFPSTPPDITYSNAWALDRTVTTLNNGHTIQFNVH